MKKKLVIIVMLATLAFTLGLFYLVMLHKYDYSFCLVGEVFYFDGNKHCGNMSEFCENNCDVDCSMTFSLPPTLFCNG